MHRRRPMGEPFEHRSPGWIRQSRECRVQSIHNHMVVDFRSMSSVNFAIRDSVSDLCRGCGGAGTRCTRGRAEVYKDNGNPPPWAGSGRAQGRLFPMRLDRMGHPVSCPHLVGDYAVGTAYSSSVTCWSQVTGLPVSSDSWMARWVMLLVAVAPCQWSSLGRMETVSPGRMSCGALPWSWTRPEPART
jgi:hypothetical protein